MNTCRPGRPWRLAPSAPHIRGHARRGPGRHCGGSLRRGPGPITRSSGRWDSGASLTLWPTLTPGGLCGKLTVRTHDCVVTQTKRKYIKKKRSFICLKYLKIVVGCYLKDFCTQHLGPSFWSLLRFWGS